MLSSSPPAVNGRGFPLVSARFSPTIILTALFISLTSYTLLKKIFHLCIGSSPYNERNPGQSLGKTQGHLPVTGRPSHVHVQLKGKPAWTGHYVSKMMHKVTYYNGEDLIWNAFVLLCKVSLSVTPLTLQRHTSHLSPLGIPQKIRISSFFHALSTIYYCSCHFMRIPWRMWANTEA